MNLNKNLFLFSVLLISFYSFASKKTDKLKLNSYLTGSSFNIGKRHLWIETTSDAPGLKKHDSITDNFTCSSQSLKAIGYFGRENKRFLKISEKFENIKKAVIYTIRKKGLNQENPLGSEMYNLANDKKLFHVVADQHLKIYFFTINLKNNFNLQQINNSIKKIGEVDAKMIGKHHVNMLTDFFEKKEISVWYEWIPATKKGNLPKLKQYLFYGNFPDDPIIDTQIFTIPENQKD